MEFRPLVRKNKELPLEDCLELLRTEKRGVLSVLGDGGYPYGTPMNHFSAIGWILCARMIKLPSAASSREHRSRTTGRCR